ncbi:hypothetical protein XA68_15165 [Ophiocordyceps unilateralis]|uniref:Uncharacterized protein n=1 Tax=Ophiocordyceps unilateralis TaxID=268505 RepID=A0A2A9P8N2_OPHUN|nr:hypothetical protein XA68_15165 [Ophiocordyceps unilateralis]
MLKNLAAAAAVLASVHGHGVSATTEHGMEYSAASWELAARSGHELNDACYPQGTGRYSIPTKELMAPCMAEQLIALSCEQATQALSNVNDEKRMRAYKDCLLGGSYLSDQRGCLECKHAHNMISQRQFNWWIQTWNSAVEAFRSADPPKKSIWDTFLSRAHWGGLPSDRTGAIKPAKPLEEYYTYRPTVQSAGQFSLGEVADDGRKRRSVEEALSVEDTVEEGVKVHLVKEEHGKVISAWVDV